MLKRFFQFEASGGILIGIAALLALFIKNSPLSVYYLGFFDLPIAIKIGAFSIDKPLFLWVNDGLMVIFFFLVGLELKRELLLGQLSSSKKITLPVLGALGGIVFPALIYSYFNWHNDHYLHGWAIPAATDIAFAIGVISLFGNRVPNGLKATLVAIAIIDDLAAIIIIALFYTSELSFVSLFLGGIFCFILLLLNQKNILQKGPYILAGIALWACVLKSGIHATLAGVIIAFAIPLRVDKEKETPLFRMEKALHPWVSFAVLPLFAFANAGVSLEGMGIHTLYHPVTLGIMLGLFFGKQVGVMFMTAIGVGLKICELPEKTNWSQYYGMALLTGIGFTMSLFIGSLTFDESYLRSNMRLGVILGSILSGMLGYLVLRLNIKDKGYS